MQTAKKEITIKDGWVICPVCGRGKIARVLPDTTLHHFPGYCKFCRTETILDIDHEPEPERQSR